jgi:hypothetical protein
MFVIRIACLLLLLTTSSALAMERKTFANGRILDVDSVGHYVFGGDKCGPFFRSVKIKKDDDRLAVGFLVEVEMKPHKKYPWELMSSHVKDLTIRVNDERRVPIAQIEELRSEKTRNLIGYVIMMEMSSADYTAAPCLKEAKKEP